MNWIKVLCVDSEGDPAHGIATGGIYDGMPIHKKCGCKGWAIKGVSFLDNELRKCSDCNRIIRGSDWNGWYAFPEFIPLEDQELEAELMEKLRLEFINE